MEFIEYKSLLDYSVRRKQKKKKHTSKIIFLPLTKKYFHLDKTNKQASKTSKQPSNKNNAKFLLTPQDLHITSAAAHTHKKPVELIESDKQCKNLQIRLSCTKEVNKTVSCTLRITW